MSSDVPDDTTIDVDEIEDGPGRGIANQVADTIKGYYSDWSEENPFVVHVKTVQGTGKTLGVMETLGSDFRNKDVPPDQRKPKEPTAAFGPRHKDVKEDVEGLPLSQHYGVHFEGKDRVCTHKGYKGKHYRVHPDVSQAWCEDCPKKPGCEYFDAYNMGEAQSFTAVHSHILHLPEVLDEWQAIESVIIDESPWDTVIKEDRSITTDEIDDSLSTVRALLYEDGLANDEIGAEIESGLEEVKSAINADDAGDTFETWTEIYEKCESEAVLDDIKRSISQKNDQLGVAGQTEVVKLLLNAVPRIKEALGRITGSEQNLFEDQENARGYLWSISDGSLDVTYTRVRELRKVARGKPVFVLATEMKTSVVENVFDLPVVTIDDNVKPEVDALQLSTQKAGVTVLRQGKRQGKQLWSNLLELTTLAVRREKLVDNKTFIAVKKEFIGDVQEHLESKGLQRGKDFLLGNYYGLTGSNRFEDCDAAVLFGRPRLRNEDAYTDALLAGTPSNEIHAEKSEGEVRDALHRIRPKRKDGVRAYILTSEVDFEDEFDGEYKKGRVPEVRRSLEGDIETIEEMLEFVRERDEPPTSGEFKDGVTGGYSKVKSYREQLVDEGVLEKEKVNDGGAGNPTRQYRLARD